MKQTMITIGSCYLTVIFAGCSFVPGKSSAVELLPGWPQETVEIHLPTYPTETHPPLAGWLVHYLQGGQPNSLELASNQTSIYLSLDKNQPTAVLFYPLTLLEGQKAHFFRPAGCIYPHSRKASWVEGFAAEILYQLARSKSVQQLMSSPLSQFNWPRLTQQASKLAQRANEKGLRFSPWLLKTEPLKDAILRGTASTRNIKQHTISQIPLEEISGRSIQLKDTDTQNTWQYIYYRYIPMGFLSPQATATETEPPKLLVPLQESYAVHSENAFLIGDKISVIFTRKNRKPALVTTGIERYTRGQ